MDKHFFYAKLIPPRPTFAFDLNDYERELMGQHVLYMKGHFEAGRVILYGPVLDAAETFGVAVCQVADEAEARSIFDNDPTVLARLNTYTIAPMIVGGHA